MPSWEVHEKWAARLGLPEDVTQLVNHLSDFPDSCAEFREFCEREGERLILPLAWSHDFETIMKLPKYLQLRFTQRKGSAFVTAWYLHYVLDYIRMAPSLSAEEVIAKTEARFESSEELDLIKHLVWEHETELVSDCRK
ncbi:MAG: hypothetical protein JW945_06120 [Methanomicrobia archaeon]|nr:hypothetical protein [Methanomicrobia archaeon]